jgi:hypothetical protein
MLSFFALRCTQLKKCYKLIVFLAETKANSTTYTYLPVVYRSSTPAWVCAGRKDGEEKCLCHPHSAGFWPSDMTAAHRGEAGTRRDGGGCLVGDSALAKAQAKHAVRKGHLCQREHQGVQQDLGAFVRKMRKKDKSKAALAVSGGILIVTTLLWRRGRRCETH